MKTKLMAIINVTPDSFYAGSRAMSQQAVEMALRFVDEGADMIDIGGESTRPGSEIVSAEEELTRVLPVIEKLSKKINIPISIDTYKPDVALAAIDAGAKIVNDITGMRSKKMRELVADSKSQCVIMHMKGEPKTMQVSPTYSDVVKEVYAFLSSSIKNCEGDGINSKKIIIDPGIGFGKTTAHNLELLKNIEKFKKLKKPILVGASRKSFIGRILGNESTPLPPEDRLEGSLAIATYCALQSVDILRVHDVKETLRAIKVLELLR